MLIGDFLEDVSFGVSARLSGYSRGDHGSKARGLCKRRGGASPHLGRVL
jgi:hypothetical protein